MNQQTHNTTTQNASQTGADSGCPAPFSKEQMAYARARRAVHSLRRWYIHLTVYLIVNALLWSRFLFLGQPDWADGSRFHGPTWPYGPTLFWGIAVIIHGLLVWTRVSRRGQAWEDRKVRDYLARG